MYFPTHDDFHVSDKAKDFIEQLLTVDQNERFKKFAEIKNHMWFEDIRLNNVTNKKTIMPYRPVVYKETVFIWNERQQRFLTVRSSTLRDFLKSKLHPIERKILLKYMKQQLNFIKGQLTEEKFDNESIRDFYEVDKLDSRKHRSLGTIKVERVRGRNHAGYMAMKVINVQNVISHEMVGILDAIEEIGAPSVVRLRSLFWDNEHIYVVTEYNYWLNKIDHSLRCLRDNFSNKNPVKGANRLSYYNELLDQPRLGQGAFGEVRKVQRIGTNDFFAMKILKVQRILNGKEKSLRHLTAEIGVLSIINSPFTVDMEAMDYVRSTQCLHCVGIGQRRRSLSFDKVYVPLKRLFKERDVQLYVAELVLAIEHLHLHNIGHRDVHPKNVLVTEDGHLKLTDFNLSKIFDRNEKDNVILGTYDYMAPEIFKNSHNKNVDWWSLGVLTYTLFYGFEPYSIADVIDNKLNRTLVQSIFNNNHANNASPVARDFILKLLEHDPAKRLGSDDNPIRDHPFFEGIDWNKVFRKEQMMPYHVVGNPSDVSLTPYYIDKTVIPEMKFDMFFVKRSQFQ